MKRAIIYSLVLCAASAVSEGILAGHRVEARFAELRFPGYSLPLWAWFIVGGLYYVICFAVLYRLFVLSPTRLRNTALALLLGLMAANALWNYLFFRLQDLFLSFVAFAPYSLLALVLFGVLVRLDRTSALWLSPYLAYLIYAGAWGYGVWKLNSPPGS